MKTEQNTRIVPKRVLATIEKVRASGKINMFDKHGVIYAVKHLNYWDGFWMYRFCYGKCDKANLNYSIVLEQFSQYLKEQSK